MKIGFNLQELIVRFVGLIIERCGYVVTLEFVRKRNGVNLKSRGLYKVYIRTRFKLGLLYETEG